MTIEWLDIFAHGAIAYLIGSLTMRSRTDSIAILTAANAAFWFCREFYQHLELAAYPFGASAQTNLEWIVPALTFPLAAWIGAAIGRRRSQMRNLGLAAAAPSLAPTAGNASGAQLREIKHEGVL